METFVNFENFKFYFPAELKALQEKEAEKSKLNQTAQVSCDACV